MCRGLNYDTVSCVKFVVILFYKVPVHYYQGCLSKDKLSNKVIDRNWGYEYL